MVCCMTCPWAPTASGMTAKSGQRNDGVTAPKTQRLLTLHADIEKPTSLEENISNLHKLNFYDVMKKN